MRALWLEDRTLRYAEDVPVPQPPPGEALIRVCLAGICNTDLEMVKGYYPFSGVPGHEFVGEVASCPDAPEWKGRRVVGEINAVCGSCATCRAGRRTHCERREVLGILGRNGSFAEYLTLPVGNLHGVPPSVPDEVAVFTEPTAAALEIQQQLTIGPGQAVVVLGAGKLGTLVAQTLALTGCDLTVATRDGRAPDVLCGGDVRVVPASALPARRADIVVECTGHPAGFALAREAVRPRGTLVLKSTHHGDTPVNLSSVVVDELTLVGSRCGPFAPALELLASGRVDVAGMVASRVPLRDGLAAYQRASRPGTLKVLLAC
jgi:threonine dehydrogenase-like Zn-dependent dehydrogenase